MPPPLPRVLLLPGMSDGILQRLRKRLSSEMEFVTAPIPIPLVGLRWLANPLAMPLALVLPASPSLLFGAFLLAPPGVGILYAAVMGVVLMVLIWLLARGFVRGLINAGMRVAWQYAKPMTPSACCCAVGFSWGGGILNQMIAEQRWSGHALLLCPATVAMATVAGVDPPPRFTSAAARKVVVVAAKSDPACSEDNVRIFRKWGAQGEVVDDVHKLLKEESLDVVVAALRRLVAEATAAPLRQ